MLDRDLIGYLETLPEPSIKASFDELSPSKRCQMRKSDAEWEQQRQRTLKRRRKRYAERAQQDPEWHAAIKQKMRETKATLYIRDYGRKCTPEERSKAAKRAAEKLGPEKRSARSAKAWHMRGLSLETRLRMHIRAQGDCHVWTGSVNRDGRPIIYWNRTHKAVRKLVKPATRLFVTCGNELCVNPEHLTPWKT